ncbi:hypothetical protein AB0362_20540 [Rhodococcus sp. NPDC079359]|uniref:hypothetical protein n=1 Tax=Rhodococcus sp. NPDC079359 TaxID=3154961 RepID=UPI00344B103C
MSDATGPADAVVNTATCGTFGYGFHGTSHQYASELDAPIKDSGPVSPVCRLLIALDT